MAISPGWGSFTLMTMSAPSKTSLAVAVIFAPAATYSASWNPEPVPAWVSTTTAWPAATRALAPAGVSPTRFSLFLISLGHPTRMATPGGNASVYTGSPEAPNGDVPPQCLTWIVAVAVAVPWNQGSGALAAITTSKSE